MKVGWIHSIRTRMVVMLVVFSLLIVLLSCFVNRIFMESYYVENKTKHLIQAYESVNDFLISSKQGTGLENAKELVSELETEGISVLVVDSELAVTFSSGFGYNRDMLFRRMQDILFEESTGEDVIFQHEDYLIQKMFDEDNQRDYLEMCGEMQEDNHFFVMRCSLESISETVRMANEFYLDVSVVVIMLGIVTMLLFSFSFTHPILKLADISQKMSNLDFDARFTVKGNDEIAVLGTSINTLSDKLEHTISELKSANIQLEKDIQHKIEIDEMRKDFLSNVSHELKTPIALIQGYAEGLKESVNDDEESRDFYCDVIIDEATKMNRMVQKLLTLNQIEFGNQNVTMERFDLIAVIDQILNRSNILLEEKNAEVFFDNHRQRYVWSDEFQIEEVLTNYITNAIHHLDERRQIAIRLEEMGELVRVHVFNSGEHIPESELDKVWIKFYKVDKARSRDYGGSGIGLSIVKAIMDSLNMNCGVENVLGGVDFWFEVEKDKNNY